MKFFLFIHKLALVFQISQTFLANRLEDNAIAPTYSTLFNPMVSTRAYMSTGRVSLWLDQKSLRQEKVVVIREEFGDSGRKTERIGEEKGKQLLLQDSGIVSV